MLDNSMANSLHVLIKALATANDERSLRLRFMDRVGEYFGVQRWGIHLLDAQSCLAEFDIRGLPDVFVERYFGSRASSRSSAALCG